MPSNLTKHSVACLLMLTPWVATVVGCGPQRPETIPTSGVVTLDGKLLVGASVMFVPVNGGRPATGVTDTEGRYSLTSFERGDGAAAGRHRITVLLFVPAADAPVGSASGGEIPSGIDPSSLPMRWLVPERYSQPDTSGLEATITAELHDVPLALHSEPKQRPLR